jgi:hypothetical protein
MQAGRGGDLVPAAPRLVVPKAGDVKHAITAAGQAGDEAECRGDPAGMARAALSSWRASATRTGDAGSPTCPNPRSATWRTTIRNYRPGSPAAPPILGRPICVSARMHPPDVPVTHRNAVDRRSPMPISDRFSNERSAGGRSRPSADLLVDLARDRQAATSCLPDAPDAAREYVLHTKAGHLRSILSLISAAWPSWRATLPWPSWRKP